ncbi:MAG TPA: hypothetical protein VL326_34365 [Kofleriaceae bacterium]|jgi:hypothetical protein|nr:hypothetical protein [Kofleriaceae bacterium]
MKTTILSASILFLLCAPALADSSYTVDITMTNNAQKKYQIMLVDNGCGDMQVKQAKSEAYFKVCAKPAAQGRVTLELERRTRDGADEVTNHGTVTTTPKSSFTLLDMKVSVQ